MLGEDETKLVMYETIPETLSQSMFCKDKNSVGGYGSLPATPGGNYYG